MKAFNPQLSRHAARRCAQRNLTAEDAALVLRFGHIEHRTGVEFYFLGKRNIPEGMERELERLIGVTIMVSDGEIITAYRNRRALSGIKRKLKHRISARITASKGLSRRGGLSESRI